MGLAPGAAVLLSLVVFTAGARAATLTVTTTADHEDGSCTPSDCTLREAIAHSSAGELILVPPGTYTLSEGDLQIAKSLVIDGSEGARKTIVNGDGASRVFTVTGGSSLITGLTISGGNGESASNNGVGGGVWVDSGATLAIDHSTISGDSAATSGGGIDVDGHLSLTASTVAEDKATEAGAIGGGIGNFGEGVELVNSTIADDEAAGEGGGIFNGAGLTTLNSTIADNYSEQEGGGIGSRGGTLTPVNTILAGNAAPAGANCAGTETLTEPAGHSHNLASDSSCGFLDPTDLQNTDPLLGPLLDNGGSTDTLALGAGSPAIDGAEAAACPSTDQRDVSRPQGAGCDIGAYESEGVALTADPTSPPPLAPRSPVAVPPGAFSTTPPPSAKLRAIGGPLLVDPKAHRASLSLACSAPEGSKCKVQGVLSARQGNKPLKLGTISGELKGQGIGTLAVHLTTTKLAGTVHATLALKSVVAGEQTVSETIPISLTLAAAGPKPRVATGAASGITGPSYGAGGTPAGAVLSGTVNPEGVATSYYFEIGLGAGFYERTLPSSPAKLPADHLTQIVTAKANDLLFGALTFHYRLVAQSAAGTSYGADKRFNVPLAIPTAPVLVPDTTIAGPVLLQLSYQCLPVGGFVVTGATISCTVVATNPQPRSILVNEYEIPVREATMVLDAVAPPGTVGPSGGEDTVVTVIVPPLGVVAKTLSFTVEHPLPIVMPEIRQAEGAPGIAPALVVDEPAVHVRLKCSRKGSKANCDAELQNVGADIADIESLKVQAPGLEGAESVGAEPPTILPDPLAGGGLPQTVSLRFDAPRGKAGKEVTVVLSGRSETDRTPFVVSASATVPGSNVRH